jgi:hypothetical protein
MGDQETVEAKVRFEDDGAGGCTIIIKFPDQTVRKGPFASRASAERALRNAVKELDPHARLIFHNEN